MNLDKIIIEWLVFMIVYSFIIILIGCFIYAHFNPISLNKKHNRKKNIGHYFSLFLIIFGITFFVNFLTFLFVVV